MPAAKRTAPARPGPSRAAADGRAAGVGAGGGEGDRLDRIADATAAEIGRALATGETSALALTERLLARIAAGDPAVFIRLTPERARAEAVAADARLAAGRPLSPLDGVPIAWKDLVDMAGERTTAGSALHADAIPAVRDADVVANAARAGMVSLGKLNLAEFAYSALGQNPHFGTPANPAAPVGGPAHAPGGSSSASGAAVAGGLAPCALGSDTGGSIRIPASFCGVVGYKSSGGRLPLRGVFPLSETQDTVGPLCRSVEDAALLDAVLRGAPAPAPAPLDIANLSLLVPEGAPLTDLQPEVAESFERALSALARAGAWIRRVRVPALDRVAEALAARSIIAAEAYALHREALEGPELARIDPRVAARILVGRTMTAADLVALHRLRREAMAELSAALDGALLAMPTTLSTAPSLAAIEDDEGFRRATGLANRNTGIGSFLDLPGLAIPSGRDRAGLPTSFLLSAPRGEDPRLLRAGLGVEPLIRTS
ncbi:amidase family protein [Albimonas sp. CAU 1670]|uniref:amidase family protein n=1 Tax=Albimonas sp. CAU 1670 TaxID=3032599 RepID=UPI0023DBA1C8|nr:amidase family protein [Albimonas sp. CAU 1670]MDF2230961.1 amidase family protein [Albimonas sp. CAU 1670]